MKKINFAFIAVLILSINLASSALQAVGPASDPVNNGFPDWYSDTNNLALQLCLDQNGMCILTPAFDPATLGFSQIGTVASGNFPDESFYFIADADPSPANVRLPGANTDIKITYRAALEQAFLSGLIPGTQSVFLRTQVDVNGLRPNSVYTATTPYGTFDITTDAFGGGRTRLEDMGGCTAGVCNFDFILPAPQTHIGPFLKWDSSILPAAPAGHIGDPAVPHAVANGPNGNTLTITGPDVGGPGINTIQTNLFKVSGKMYFLPETKVAFTTQPSTIASTNLIFSQQPVVEVQDVNNVLVPTATSPVTISAFSDAACTIPATGILSGTTTQAAVAGVSTFTDLLYSQAETIFLQASSGTLTSVCSSALVVNAIPALASISISPSQTMDILATQQLTAATLDQFGNPIQSVLTWQSSNPGVATVDANGLVTAVSAGTATITASSGVIFGSVVISVNAAPVILPPVITDVIVPTAPIVDTVFTIPVIATDPNANPLTFTLVDAPVGLTIDTNTGVITGTVAVAGQVNLNVVVSNGVTSVTNNIALIVSDPATVNNPPVVTAPISIPIITTVPINVPVPVIATDPNADTLTFTLIDAPVGVTIDTNTGVITGTVDVAGVTHCIVQVSDGVNTVSVPVDIEAVAQNNAPVVTIPAQEQINFGENFEIPATATDADGDALEFSLIGAPEGITIDVNTGLIAGNIADSKITSFSVKVSDGKTETIVPIVLKIEDNPNLAPELNVQENTELLQNTEISIQAAATDPEGKALVFSLVNAPQGLTIDQSGHITGSLPAGIYTCDVQVKDKKNTVTKTISIIINAPENHDADGDGFTPAQGDCDDNNNLVWQQLSAYADSDLDGHGSANLQTVCSGISIPSGFVFNGDDCDDNNVGTWQLLQGYLDADGDGHGVGDLQNVCSGISIPSGFVDTHDDCNDQNANTHPSAAESDDNEDNDCNGYNDEGIVKGETERHDNETGEDYKFEINDSGSGKKKVTAKINNETAVEFEWDTQTSALNTSAIKIKKSNSGRGGMIIEGAEAFTINSTKTVFVDKVSGSNKVCVKDAVISNLSEISEACTGENETLLICDGTIQGAYNCSAEGNFYKITGLKHSGILEQLQPQQTNNGGGGSIGGGSSRSSSSGSAVRTNNNINVTSGNNAINTTQGNNHVQNSDNNNLNSPITGAVTGSGQTKNSVFWIAGLGILALIVLAIIINSLKKDYKNK